MTVKLENCLRDHRSCSYLQSNFSLEQSVAFIYVIWLRNLAFLATSRYRMMSSMTEVVAAGRGSSSLYSTETASLNFSEKPMLVSYQHPG